MLGGTGDGGHGAIGGVEAPATVRVEEPFFASAEERSFPDARPPRALTGAPDAAAAQGDGSDGERSWLSASRLENPGLPDPALSYGEPSVSFESALADPELNPNDYAQNLAVPLAEVSASDLHPVNAMPDHDEQWYEDEDENPHDDFAGLELAAPLLAAIGHESEPPLRAVAQFQLIPYQLSGLAMYVPLPPASPLRQFVLSRKRLPGRQAWPQPEADDDADDAARLRSSRDPIEPL